ncbi:DUF421 domain-containing protein [Mucilaginibacter sp. AK015]|uniref:DUF421 domain-containing protein n=1 Tax=Mucilaginibacter sp. AK015 TaxID=2723072 RepID=UPI00160A0CBF|nr:DUF421 domain-containing protein [Mucilaginibacter sp. AK015]MBB5394737.1 uncharacterized membrane protein YcaP (DUF421 family) [Mucilaginibacter sp. AK015]
MEIFIKIFGEGKDLNVIQMSSRGVVVFFIALLLIRVSGRRSFGVKNPLDNIITISLGAVLSRAIVGVSPFIPVVVCCFVIVLLHRLFGWLVATNNRFVRVMEGDKILLFDKDRFLRDQMKRALVCEEDLMQGVRKSALTEDMDKIEKVYMERNGDISAIKKQG